MKKIIACRLMPVLALLFSLSTNALSQEATNSERYGNFIKRIENNQHYSRISYIVEDTGEVYPGYNLGSKSRLERMLLPEFNAHVEYCFRPTYKFLDIPSAIRIVKDSLSDAPYTLDVKWITNWREVLEPLREKYPVRGVSWEENNSISDEEIERIAQYNREMFGKIGEERFDHYEIETLTVPVGALGDRLFEKMFALIDGCRAKDVIRKSYEAYSLSFRCLVGDEVWTLSIQEMPDEGKILQMSDLCRQIIEDVRAGTFDEQKYIGMLESIEF